MQAIFIDVAGLGDVNNAHGHLAGDLVLQRTADAMRQVSRSGDLLVRWGGDEFLVLGLGEHLDASDFERRLCQQVDMTGLTDHWKGGLHVGLATDHVESLDDLIRQADAHMYERRAQP